MPEEKKPIKSIIKRTPSLFEPKEDKRSPHTSVEHRRTSIDSPRHTGYFQLAVPKFFGGTKQTNSVDGSHPRGSSFGNISGSFISTGGDDQTLRPGQKVRFLDRLSIRSISAIFIPSSGQEFHDGNKERQMQLQDIQDDPSYLPGFVDLYYSTEISITEDTCCCSIQTSFTVRDESNEKSKPIYVVQQEIDGACLPCMKFCCFRKYDIMRIGFIIRVYNEAISTKLLTFKRKTHFLADQLDIVETYYSIENSHVGRIEKTKDGFRLVDSRGTEMYRVLRESKQKEQFLTYEGTLIVFSCETRKVVAKITYFKRKYFGKLCSMFMKPLKHTIRWSPEIGVAMKTLLLGVLFLELHSFEEYVDLPLGRDANVTINPTTNKRRHSFM